MLPPDGWRLEAGLYSLAFKNNSVVRHNLPQEVDGS